MRIAQYAGASGLGRVCREADGEILFSCSRLGPEKYDRGRYDSGVIRSADDGDSWNIISEIIPGSAECQLLRLDSGRWLTTIRSVGRPGDRLLPNGELTNP